MARQVNELGADLAFLLIAGEDGQAWCEAAEKIAAQSGLPLDAIRLGHLDGDYRDLRSTWAAARRHTPQGAVLVRPDRFIGWRAHGAATDPVADRPPHSTPCSHGRGIHPPLVQPVPPTVATVGGAAPRPLPPRTRLMDLATVPHTAVAGEPPEGTRHERSDSHPHPRGRRPPGPAQRTGRPARGTPRPRGPARHQGGRPGLAGVHQARPGPRRDLRPRLRPDHRRPDR
ncbi:aromatic-ring hydroxylase C-terminal domain-containing protein [Streptomyces sp. NPDC001514]